MAIQLNAEIRNVAGKGAARSVRNNKKIPAVIYGDKKEPVTIELDGRSFEMLLRQPGLRTKLFEITAGKVQENAMLIDIQYHPVTDAPIHVDFKRIDVKKTVTVNVPVETINAEQCKGLKFGGTLNFAVRKVELVGLVESLPATIAIDLAELNMGDTVHGSDLKLPAGVSLGLHQAELAFATIAGKIVEEKAEASAATGKGGKAAKGKK